VRRVILTIIVVVTVFLLVVLIIMGVRKVSAPSGGSKKANPVSVTSLVALAKDLEAKGSLLEAKAAYQKLIAEIPNAAEVMSWQKKVEEINVKLLFSPIPTPKSTTYTIKPGDTLTKIAREFKTTTELLQKSNRLNGDKIVPGQRIKVSTAAFTILVYKSQNILILKADDEFVKTYIVATGANNSTPVGTFKIVNKLTNPTWFKAGAVVPAESPENVLGTRWLGFDVSGYGIHGTIEPQTLGKSVTQGCVRMANPEVEELYAIVPQGTTVTIVD